MTAAPTLSIHHQCVFAGDLVENGEKVDSNLAIILEAPRGTIKRPETKWYAFGPGSRIQLPERVQKIFEHYGAGTQKEIRSRIGAPLLTPQPPDEVITVIESAAMLDPGADVTVVRAQLEEIAEPLRSVLWTTVGVHVLLAGGQGFTRLIAQATAVWDRGAGQLHWRSRPPLSAPAQPKAFAPVSLLAECMEKMHTANTEHLINAVLAYLSGCQAAADPLAMMAFIQACEILAEELHSREGEPLPSDEQKKTRERWQRLVSEGSLTKEELGRLAYVGSGRKFRRLAEKHCPDDAEKDHRLFQQLYSLRSKTAHDGHLWTEALKPGYALSRRQEAETLARKYLALRLGLKPEGLPRLDSVVFSKDP